MAPDDGQGRWIFAFYPTGVVAYSNHGYPITRISFTLRGSCFASVTMSLLVTRNLAVVGLRRNGAYDQA